ncbi:transporter substrate-binding domain-containing protein [Thermoflavimicrobium daqui]|uniref:Basic amino acid ABC transporter substrate-binding protein n=1 Tax=Thermoflavimicrobium daqui TaxID=2137476 RepID=A0A364K5L2_9BACL|nr:transporter substrate-binding domain-containing protein [Thermoflavimicrobium daqui]RAL24549.1 basic amino acid ABC transporter substrate-binding protein [Thermoflavimicrobium daqui]
MKKLLGLVMVAVVASAMILTSCNIKVDFGGKESSANGKRLVVATDAQFPPFESLGADGIITGFDAEILDASAKAAGIEVDLKHVGWDPMFKEIDQGKADAAIAAISITSERQSKYDFTNPYFVSKQLLLVPVESNAKTLGDLKGFKIGALVNSTGAATVKEEFGENYSRLKEFDDTPTAVKELAAGRLDAVVADSGVVKYYVKTLEKAEVKKEEKISSEKGEHTFVVKIGSTKIKAVEDPFFSPESYGIMVKKGNKEVIKKFNEGLQKIRANGTYDQIYKKYFGEE